MGDIFMNTPINWTNPTNLILSAYEISPPLQASNTGGASIVLQTDNTGTAL